MDLSTTYLGFHLPHPLMPGASPLADDLDSVRRLEDAGAAAIVMRSLFEEQITRESMGTVHDILVQEEASAEALSYFPTPGDYAFAPDRYLDHIRRIKGAVAVPVIASLNGTTSEGWLHYARLIQDAGADALEVNFYHFAADPRERGSMVEQRLLDVVHGIRRTIEIPIAVKLSPYFSALSHLAHELDDARADGLVLFNRFYQPDIEPEMLQAVPRLHWSSPDELLLRTRWIAVLSCQIDASLAATGGVHHGEDVVKAVLAGADAVQVVSALLVHGERHLAVLRKELSHWLEEREYESLRQAQGSMDLLHCPDPEAFERGNYLRVLQSWRTPDSRRQK